MNLAIVGAGISGLATAQAVLSLRPGADIRVFESALRIGGKVWTEIHPEGYLCEGGVNGFLDKIPRTLELCDEVRLVPEQANAAAERRYIFSQGALHKLPDKPLEFITSRLLSAGGRIRVMAEVLVSRGRHEDESLSAFATRRLGREAFEKLIDPMASGVFAGDARRLSVQSCFPRIREVEMEYGSLIRGLVSLQIKARRAGGKTVPGPGPGGRLTSFPRGMSQLTDTLAEGLGPRVRMSSPVESISRADGGYVLHLAGGVTEPAEQVVLAAPGYAQARILRGLDPQLADLLGGISYAPVSVVCLGYTGSGARQTPDGFGFLVPAREHRSILGTIVDSNVFAGRAPEGSVLLRSMVGGARSPELAALGDEQLISRVRSDLKDITGLDAEPEFTRIFRHDKAIPQYEVGHAARLSAIDEALRRHPGLRLSGNALRGVSLNDCVVNALKTAKSLLEKT